MGIVTPSPWPLLTSCSALGLVSSLLFKLKYYDFEVFFLIFCLLVLLLIAAFWWADIIRESTFLGLHTVRVQSQLRSGMILLIVSEIFFFWFFLGLPSLWSFSQYRIGFGLASPRGPSSGRYLTVNFQLGQVFPHTTMDGRDIRVKVTKRGNNLIERQFGRTNTTITRTFTNDKMEVNLEANGVIASSVFTREQ